MQKGSVSVGVLVVAGLIIASVATAEPGEGINIDGWKISPKLGASATYDSNVDSTSVDEKSDVFFDINAALDVAYKASMLQLDSLFFAGHRFYSDESQKDFGSGGENIKVTLQEEKNWKFSVSESYRKVEDIDQNAIDTINVGGISSATVMDSSSRERRDVVQVAVGAAKMLTEKLGVEAGYRFDDVNYDGKTLNDLSGHTVELEGGMKITDKTAGLATAVYGTQDNGVSDNADFCAVRAGFKTEGTDKVSFKGGVGGLFYNRPTEGASDENTISYDLMGVWKATDKIAINAGGRNGVQLSSLAGYEDNPAKFNMVWLGSEFKVMPTMVLNASVSYRQDAYLDPVEVDGAMIDRTDDGFSGRIRADYAPAGLKFVQLFGEALYESVDSDVSDYSDTRVAVGASVRY